MRTLYRLVDPAAARRLQGIKMSDDQRADDSSLTAREKAILRIAFSGPPTDGEQLESSARKERYLREMLEEATQNAILANRELQRFYDAEWRQNSVERALRVLDSSPDHSHLFRILVSHRFRGDFDLLCDGQVWALGSANPETIVKSLKRMRAKLHSELPGQWNFRIKRPKNQFPGEFVWLRRADFPGWAGS